jgi:hypothetical protein
VSEWTTPTDVLPAEPMVALRERWQRLADQHPSVVRLLGPDAGSVSGEESVGVAPALAQVVEALPGVALGGVVLDWPQSASQTWPELDDRHTYQPVHANGREAIVVRIDPESGAAGEVVHVTGDGGVEVLDTDVLAWWEALTSWAEQALPALAQELEPEAADEEELQMLLEESVEQDFQEWLQGQG